MKKSKATLMAEAGHCREIAEALSRALDYVGPFADNGEGGWTLRRLVKKARALMDKFFSRALTIEKEITAMDAFYDT